MCMELDKRYKEVSHVPADRLKTIQGGRLSGMTDINPQWKITAMTQVYGLCGEGWKFAIVDKQIVPVAGTGETMIYMTVSLQVKKGDAWSEPIYGCGGDFLLKREKGGVRANDEAFKMCLTDALGNAMKYIGVAADVYEKLQDTKYMERPSAIVQDPAETHNENVNKFTDFMQRNNIDAVDFIRRYSRGKYTKPADADDGTLMHILEKSDSALKWYAGVTNEGQG